jgi:hypothetical protein
MPALLFGKGPAAGVWEASGGQRREPCSAGGRCSSTK